MKTFDFAVANPPFSAKAWSNGLNPSADEFQRFKGYGIPPAKNGDYAFLLHMIRSLNLTQWFYYYFCHRELTPYLTRQGAGRYKLTKNALLQIPCAIPPTIEEQKAIAQILSDMDAEITALEKKRDKYKAIKQGMMQQLLTGKTRLNAD